MRFQKLPLCTQEAVQRSPSSIFGSRSSVYNSSGLRQQDGHLFDFFPKAGRIQAPDWLPEAGGQPGGAIEGS